MNGLPVGNADTLLGFSREMLLSLAGSRPSLDPFDRSD